MAHTLLMTAGCILLTIGEVYGRATNSRQNSGGSTIGLKSNYDYICNGIESGLFPHPDSCTKFIQCANGNAYEFECPDELYFNPETNQCDFPENVHCEEPEAFSATEDSTPTTASSTALTWEEDSKNDLRKV